MTIFKSKSKCASIRKQLRLGGGIPFFWLDFDVDVREAFRFGLAPKFAWRGGRGAFDLRGKVAAIYSCCDPLRRYRTAVRHPFCLYGGIAPVLCTSSSAHFFRRILRTGYWYVKSYACTYPALCVWTYFDGKITQTVVALTCLLPDFRFGAVFVFKEPSPSACTTKFT
jgi:hypothetical protein